MSPEVIRHETYNYSADVYSFGLLLWEMITREKPFEPKSPIEAAGAVALEGKRPPFPKGTPPAVKELIEQCWAEKPSERMEEECIIKCLGELVNNFAAMSWLGVPFGRPVYKKEVMVQDDDTPDHGPPPNIEKMHKKRSSMLKSGLFRKKK